MPDATTETDIDALRADMKRLRDDVLALSQTIAGLTARQAARGMDAAHDASDKVVETVQKAAEDVKRVGGEGLAALEEKIAERPVSAILIALGLGLLIGKLTERR